MVAAFRQGLRETGFVEGQRQPLRLNTAGQMVNMIDCRGWRLI